MTVNIDSTPMLIPFEKIEVGDFFTGFLPQGPFETEGTANYLYLKISDKSAFSFKSNIVYTKMDFTGKYYPLKIKSIEAVIK